MNLVAKEFVATRQDERGVLILSCFTGAARELRDALQVNPYDIDQTAEAIRTALEMNAEEKQQRMQRMRKTIREQNVYRWAASLIGEVCDVEVPIRIEGQGAKGRLVADAGEIRRLENFPQEQQALSRVRVLGDREQRLDEIEPGPPLPDPFGEEGNGDAVDHRLGATQGAEERLPADRHATQRDHVDLFVGEELLRADRALFLGRGDEAGDRNRSRPRESNALNGMLDQVEGLRESLAAH